MLSEIIIGVNLSILLLFHQLLRDIALSLKWQEVEYWAQYLNLCDLSVLGIIAWGSLKVYLIIKHQENFSWHF